MIRPAVRVGRLATALLALAVAGRAGADPCQGTPSATRLDIVVDGVRTDQGLITTTLYPAEPAKFLKPKGEIAVWRVPAKAPSTETCVFLPAPGVYAVAVYDDVNSNLRFDHNALGPQEPYGFSNDPRLLLAPPSARAAAFEAPAGGATIHIRLRYPH